MRILLHQLDGTQRPVESLTPQDLGRHRELRAFGARPYPMPYIRTPELVGFQRWIVGPNDKRIPWGAWKHNNYRPENLSLNQSPKTPA